MSYFVDLPDAAGQPISPADLREREDRYRAYLDSIQAQVPADAWAFAAVPWHYDPADSRCLHQARIQKVTIREVPPLMKRRRRPMQIRVRLFSAHRDGYSELLYKNVRRYNLFTDAPWLYDEIFLTPGGVIHEVSVGAGKHWRIECDDILCEWKPLRRATRPTSPHPQIDAQTVAQLAAGGAYCVQCRKKVPMQDAEQVIMRNGRPAIKGRCGTCNMAIFRIGARPTAA